MLKGYVLENIGAPGTGATITLGTAPTGRRTYSAAFTTGSLAYWVLDDGTKAEWGYGTLTIGSPSTITRTTTGNTSGTTAALNFAGATRIFCALPPEKAVYVDNGGTVTLPGNLVLPNNFAYYIKDLGGTSRPVLYMSTANEVIIGQASGKFRVMNQGLGSEWMNISSTGLTEFGGSGGNWAGSIVSAQNNNIATGWCYSAWAFNIASSVGCFLARVEATAKYLMVFYFGGTTQVGGITTNGTTTTYGTTSDRRLKNDYGPDDGSLIYRVKIHRIAFKAQPDVMMPGVMADELQEVMPWAVSGEKDAVHEQDVLDADGKVMIPKGTIKPQNVDYSKIVAPLVSFSQHTERRTAANEQTIHMLLQEIADLKARVAQLEAA